MQGETVKNLIVQQGSDFKVLSKVAEFRLWQDRHRVSQESGNAAGAKFALDHLRVISVLYLNELLACAEALHELDPKHPALKRLS